MVYSRINLPMTKGIIKEENDTVKSGHKICQQNGQKLWHYTVKIARPDEVWFVNDVPKTRSGKIMRREVRDEVMSNTIGDISTLANPEVIDEIERSKKNILAADIPYNKELHMTFSC